MKQPETPERWNVLEKSGPSESMIRRVSKVNNFEMALIPGRGGSPMICDWKPCFSMEASWSHLEISPGLK